MGAVRGVTAGGDSSGATGDRAASGAGRGRNSGGHREFPAGRGSIVRRQAGKVMGRRAASGVKAVRSSVVRGRSGGNFKAAGGTSAGRRAGRRSAASGAIFIRAIRGSITIPGARRPRCRDGT
jgi:hypothetical protein